MLRPEQLCRAACNAKQPGSGRRDHASAEPTASQSIRSDCPARPAGTGRPWHDSSESTARGPASAGAGAARASSTSTRTAGGSAEPSVIERIRELAIPPAWEDVWICPYPMGHIQATGHGRRRPQAVPLPRPLARAPRPREVRVDGRASPARCRSCASAWRRTSPSRACRASGCSPARSRLLDLGFFRIGSEDYAEENDTYGLATMRKRHVTVDGRRDQLRLRGQGRPAPGAGVRRPGGGRDRRERSSAAAAAATSCSPTRTAGAGSTSGPRTSTSTSRRPPAASSPPRTSAPGAAPCWRRSALAVSGAGRRGSKTARKRAKTRAIKEVARYLGNTPAVCRASYIDPRVFDRFDGGLTIGGVLPELAEDTGALAGRPGTVEEGVLDLLAATRRRELRPQSSEADPRRVAEERSKRLARLAAQLRLTRPNVGGVGRGRLAADAATGAPWATPMPISRNASRGCSPCARAVHPGSQVIAARGGAAPRAPGEVLAHGPAARARRGSRPGGSARRTAPSSESCEK